MRNSEIYFRCNQKWGGGGIPLTCTFKDQVSSACPQLLEWIYSGSTAEFPHWRSQANWAFLFCKSERVQALHSLHFASNFAPPPLHHCGSFHLQVPVSYSLLVISARLVCRRWDLIEQDLIVTGNDKGAWKLPDGFNNIFIWTISWRLTWRFKFRSPQRKTPKTQIAPLCFFSNLSSFPQYISGMPDLICVRKPPFISTHNWKQLSTVEVLRHVQTSAHATTTAHATLSGAPHAVNLQWRG